MTKVRVKERNRKKRGQHGGLFGIPNSSAQALTSVAAMKALEKFLMLVMLKYGLHRAMKAWEVGSREKVNPWLRKFLQWVPNIAFTVAMVYPSAFQNPVVGAIAASFFRYIDDWLAKQETAGVAVTDGMVRDLSIAHQPHAESVTQAIAAPPPPIVSPAAVEVPPPLPAVVSEVATEVKRRMRKAKDVVEKGAKGAVWVAKGAASAGAYVVKELHDDVFTDRKGQRGRKRKGYKSWTFRR